MPRLPRMLGRRSLLGIIRTRRTHDASLGMDRAEFNKNLHSLKKRLLRGNDNVIIHVPSGDVFFNGEHIGNVFDG
jgi:hypothetical protein